MRGKINLFALDALVNMAAAANMRIEMRVFAAPMQRGAGSVSVKPAADKRQAAAVKKTTTADKPATKRPARRGRGGVTAAIHAR
jgi:hypothetical protein